MWIKANAGMPELIDREVVYRMTPAEFAGHVDGLVAAGAGFIGGCWNLWRGAVGLFYVAERTATVITRAERA